jgi:branched-chain amino acid aminotransferase
LAQKQAKAAGYADCLFLSPLASGDCVEEAGASNFFVLKGKQLRTPGLGTILPGVTRDSVIRLAKDMGYEVVEGGVEFDSLQGADECFCCGTGASVTPIGAIDVEGAPGRAVTFGEDKGATAGPFTMAVSDRLEAIRTGADTSAVGDGWAHVVAPRAPVAGVYDGPPRVGDAGRR